MRKVVDFLITGNARCFADNTFILLRTCFRMDCSLYFLPWSCLCHFIVRRFKKRWIDDIKSLRFSTTFLPEADRLAKNRTRWRRLLRTTMTSELLCQHRRGIKLVSGSLVNVVENLKQRHVDRPLRSIEKVDFSGRVQHVKQTVI